MECIRCRGAFESSLSGAWFRKNPDRRLCFNCMAADMRAAKVAEKESKPKVCSCVGRPGPLCAIHGGA